MKMLESNSYYDKKGKNQYLLFWYKPEPARNKKIYPAKISINRLLPKIIMDS